MKKQRKLICLLTAIVMTVAMMPALAFAGVSETKALPKGFSIGEMPVYAGASGQIQNLLDDPNAKGSYKVSADGKVLTLNSAQFASEEIAVRYGTQGVNSAPRESAAKGAAADEATIVLEGNNVINVKNSTWEVRAIRSDANLTFKGSGNLKLTNASGQGIYAYSAEYSITFAGTGKIDVTAISDAIVAWKLDFKSGNIKGTATNAMARAIFSDTPINVTCSTLAAKASTGQVALGCANGRGEGDIVLGSKLKITKPAGGVIGDFEKDGWKYKTVMQKDKKTIASDIVISAASELKAPTNVKAKATSSKVIKVSWKKATGAKSYSVYKATKKAGDYSFAAKTSKVSANIKGLKADTRYYFKVKAKSSDATSAFSKVATAKTKKKIVKSAAVKNLRGKIENGAFCLKWNKAARADGYQIKFNKTGQKEFKELKKITVYSKTHIHTANYINGRMYAYKVRAFNKVDGKKVYGKWSNKVTMVGYWN